MSSDGLGFGTLIALSLAVLLAAPVFSPVTAQTQTISVTPGSVNLGMTVTVNVTAPAAGTYTVLIVKPSGATASMTFTFAAVGQKEGGVFGNASEGFNSMVDEVGTYNVFLEQGSQVVGTTSLYATNKLLVSMDMVNGGLCDQVPGGPRGTKFFPRFYVVYAATGTPMTNNSKGAYVTYTFPDGTQVNASWHRPTAEASNYAGSGGDTGFFIGKFQPNWNYTAVGDWVPTAVIGDAYGNTATFKWSGPAYPLTPATLVTSVQLADPTTGALVSGLYTGQTVKVMATITYPVVPEGVSGFTAPLDTAARGGVVNAQIGWGFYNTTSNSFGSATEPGGLISQVAMTYTGANGTWTGDFTASSLPALLPGTNFVAVVTAADKASPPNTGLAMLTVPNATIMNVTTTQTAVSTVTSTASATSTVSQASGISTVVYAGMAILLIIGVVVGYVMRVPRR